MRSRAVQTILVDPKLGTHQETILAAAKASLLSLAAADRTADLWTEWLSGPMTKIVKTTSRSKMRQAIKDVPGAQCWSEGEAFAIAFPPADREDQHLLLAKARVGEIQRSRQRKATPIPVLDSGVLLIVRKDLHMSTGKAAAQAGHALTKLATIHPELLEPDVALDAVQQVTLMEMPGDDLMACVEGFGAAAVIFDSGRTEIPAGSLTAAAILGRL